MKITKLVLKGYRGFRLKAIEFFEIKPKQKTQVILGSNGSGKSSLVRELSPLPANAADYSKGGYKEITIEHNQKTYVLSSHFTQEGPRYTFMVDGENLNPGHTVTVYRELVKEHFNYTNDVHLLMTGKTKFRSMSVADRRNWFTKISDIDYLYALKYHGRLKDKIRGLQGAMDRLKLQLTQETEKCLNEAQANELRLKLFDLNGILGTLLDHRKPRIDQSFARQNIEKIENDLERVSERLETLLSSAKGNTRLKDIDALRSDSMRISAESSVLLNEVVQRSEKIEKYQKELDAINQTSNCSLEEIEKNIAALEAEENELLGMVKLSIHFDDPVNAQSAFESLRNNYEALISELVQCPRLNYTRSDYQALTKATYQYEQNMLKSSQRADLLLKERQHMELHRDKGAVDCPKCNHHWTPNYDERKYQQLVSTHEASIKEAELSKEAFKKHIDLIAEHEHFFGIMSRFHDMVRYFDTLSPYWNWVTSGDSEMRLLTDLTSVQNSIQTLSFDLRYLSKIEAIRKQQHENRRLQGLMMNAKQFDKDKIQKEIELETNYIIQAQHKLRQGRVDKEEIDNTVSLLMSISEYSSSLKSIMESRDTSIRMLIEDCCVAALDEMIRSVKYSISQYERTLSQIDIQRGIVVNLENQIKAIETELRLLKVSQKALSPSEGLIAKGMTGFINHFVKQLNEFISRIWLYPLALEPIEITDEDSVDLDYRFSVRVNDDLPVPDVSLCSSGMQEVIDLAFVAVSMKYLRLSNFPIFLDEFAVALDQAHRQSAYQVIEHLINSSDYSQVFVVSHYQDGYSSLTASDVLVLCDSNVQIPVHMAYNAHVTMQ